MTGRAKATVFALLVLGLGFLFWSLNGNRPDEHNTSSNEAEQNGEVNQPADSSGNREYTGVETDPKQDNTQQPNSEAEAGITQPIERSEVVGKLRLTGPDGKSVGGMVELVKVNETFTTHFTTMSRIGSAIYYDSIVQEQEVGGVDAAMEITADGNRADFIIVVAPGFSPYLDSWTPITPNEERLIELTAAKPIAVTVLTSEGLPIKDAQVWYRWTGVFSQNKSAPLLDRFRERFFQGVESTDEQGIVVLTSTFPQWHTQLFIRPGDLWATVVKTAEAGTPIEIQCPDAFMATGFVTVNGKVPDQEVQLKASVHQGDQYWMLESGRAKEEGKYKITGIPTGYPAYQIEAMGNGLANLTQDIFAPEPGGIINLDFKMVEGIGGTLKLIDPWGAPIPDGRVKFVAEGDRSHMYGYNSDADGSVELPSVFRKGDSWWLNLRLGDNLYLRVEQEFHAGAALEITVPNLARITNLEIPEDLLGDATIKEVLWSGHSSQSWGTAAWTPQTADSILLASGSANLKITLSDGRQFQQPVVLKPGSANSIALEQLPATLSFELPSDPPASVNIKTQNGITAFEQSELSGKVSIPLAQGRYSFVAIWPETAREIPLLNIADSELNLGKIEPTTAGYIEGIVLDANGNPVQWADVHLASISGYNSQFWATEADGWFGFFDVPLGQYYVLCDTSNSHASNSTTLIETITITADRLNHQLDLQLPQGEQNQVRLTCGNDWNFNSYAILATSSGSSHAALRSQGPTIMTSQQQSGWVGAAQLLDGSVIAQAMPVPAGSGEYTLPSAAMRSARLQLVDEFGEPWKHLLLRMELNGQPFTRRPTLDSTGSLSISANAEAPWSLQICAPSGQVLYFDFSALNSSETLVIPREIIGHSITVRNEAGEPLPWPTLQSADGATVFPSDRDGRAIIPADFQQPIVVSADGYLPCLFSDLQAATFTLPQRLDGVQVRIPAGATRLSWANDLPYQSLWSNSLQLSSDLEAAELPPMHTGKFTFSAFDAKGNSIAESDFVLHENGQSLNWK